MRHPFLVRRFALVVVLAAVTGCGGGGSSADGMVGICDVQYADPVLSVSSAKNALTGTPLPAITISDLQVNGRSFDLATLLLGAKNASVDGKLIACTVACDLGITEGKYTFVVEAPGYQKKAYAIDAKFASFDLGKCPHVLSGGVKIEVALTPIS